MYQWLRREADEREEKEKGQVNGPWSHLCVNIQEQQDCHNIMWLDNTNGVQPARGKLSTDTQSTKKAIWLNNQFGKIWIYHVICKKEEMKS